MKRSLLLLLAALLAFACDEPDPEVNAPAERSSVVVMWQRFELGEPGEPDRLDFVPACGGVAIAKDLVVTANHCVPAGGTDHYPVVTREQWFTTARDQTMAVVVDRDEGLDLAWLEPHEDLAHWTEWAPVASAPPDVLLVRYFETSRAQLDGAELVGGGFRGGDSGSGAFDEQGQLLGVISACPDQNADEACDVDRARLVRP